MKLKFILVCLGALYSVYHFVSTNNGVWHFIDNVNVIIHEAGHFIFYPFGDFITAAGGSILQVAVPLLFFWYFWRSQQKFSAAAMLLWTAINFFYVGYYASDALKMELPLLGGENVTHDWNYLLLESALIRYTAVISQLINFMGFVCVLVSVLIAWNAYNTEEG